MQPLEHRGDDFGHALVLEDPPVGTQRGTRQQRFELDLVAGTAKAGVALAQAADQAVDMADRRLATPQGEHRGQVQQAVEVDRRIAAGQLQLELERLGQAFVQGEGDHVEGIALQGFKSEAQIALARHVG